MGDQTFKPNLGMVTAAENLFLAMVIEQTIRPVVEGYQRQILQNGQWRIDAKYVGRRGEKDRLILDPKESYLMSDEDFTCYNQRCLAARDKARLSVDHAGDCPLLVAENTVVIAKHALIDAMEKSTGINVNMLLCAGMVEYNRYVDLTLRLLAPFVDVRSCLREAKPTAC